jgi:nitrile hydratase accessory protein
MTAPAIPATVREAERLLTDTGGPGFAEPWQAEAFACTIQASRQGLFTWNEWVEVFSAEIKAAPERPGEGAEAAYFRQWLAALETILRQKDAATAAEIAEREEAWRQAYLNTPHGMPVELANAARPPSGEGHHHHHHGGDHEHHAHAAAKPVAVSPAKLGMR